MLNEAFTLHKNKNYSEAKSIYQLIINTNPNYFEAISLLGNIELIEKNYDIAIKLFNNALILNPKSVTNHFNKGVALLEKSHFEQSILNFNKALDLNPNIIEVYINLSIALKQLNKLEEALDNLNKAVKINPKLPIIYFNRGIIFDTLGNFELALNDFFYAIKLNPNYFEAFNNIGNIYLKQKRYLDALSNFDKAISLDLKIAEAYYNKGITLYRLEEFSHALFNFDKSIQLEKNHANAHHYRGKIFHKLGNFDSAIINYKQAINLNTNLKEYYISLGNLYSDDNNLNQALSYYYKALKIDKNTPECYYNIGILYKKLNQFQLAIENFSIAIKHNQDYAEAYNNRGTAFKEIKLLKFALKDFEKSISLKSDNAKYVFNKSLTLLLNGNYEEGLKLYEYRWKISETRKYLRKFDKPLWLGKESLFKKKIFIYYEQGLGDTIQFIRYIKFLKEKGAETILEIQKELLPVLRKVDGIDKFKDHDESIPDFDYQCPLLSLPLALNTTFNNIPNKTPYLHINEIYIKKWEKKLKQDKFNIAISWQGSSGFKDKSFPVEMFLGISKIPKVQLINIQKHFDIEKLRTLSESLNLENYDDSFDEKDNSFIDSAAIMKCVDLVITNDSALCHLSGALNVKTWVVLQFVPDWRWMLNKSKTPWYPNHKLYRQKKLATGQQFSRRLRKI